MSEGVEEVEEVSCWISGVVEGMNYIQRFPLAGKQTFPSVRLGETSVIEKSRAMFDHKNGPPSFPLANPVAKR